MSASFPLAVAATDYALRAIVVPYIAKVRAIAPGARFTIRTVDGLDVQQQLERSDIDLAIMTPDAAAPNLHARHLFEEHYVCAMRPRSSGGRRAADTRSWLAFRVTSVGKSMAEDGKCVGYRMSEYNHIARLM